MDVTTAPYVWLAPSAERPGSEVPARADEVDHARVVRWARPRGAVLTRPAPPRASVLAMDPAIVDAIEGDLGKARDALTALDATAIDAALGHAESLLRAHPELPQASWLRAEVEREWATRFARVTPRDEARAERAWKRAAALDGGRVAGIGESALGKVERAPVTVRFTSDERSKVELRVDGRVVAPAALELGEGEHQFVALRGGRAVWAAWVATAAGTEVTIPDLSPPACSEEDFAEVRASEDTHAVDAAHVACARWFVVEGGGARIAQCRGARCGPLVPLRGAEPALALGPAPAPLKHEEGRGPAWLTWTAVGAAVLLTGGSLLYASGVFDKPDREQRWIAGGLRTE